MKSNVQCPMSNTYRGRARRRLAQINSPPASVISGAWVFGPGVLSLPLMTDEFGVRLAKRHDALSLRAIRARGLLPHELRDGSLRFGPDETPQQNRCA